MSVTRPAQVIELTGYTVDDKVAIAARHLLPKQVALHGLSPGQLSLGEEELDHLISGYTREASLAEMRRDAPRMPRRDAPRCAEMVPIVGATRPPPPPSPPLKSLPPARFPQAGVRELERKLGALCRAIAANVSEAGEAASEAAAAAAAAGGADEGAPSEGGGGSEAAAAAEAATAAAAPIALSVADIERVLGPPRFEPRRDVARRITKPGIALGLAATVFGGETLFVEVEQVAGKGAVQMTGNIKEVMQESVKAALTWIRANVAELGLAKTASEALLNTTDLHIHFPEGATPKDGPSAGVTITTALTSLLTGRLVRNDVAMTGEITLRGLVLPVGGIKEKVVAAHRAGVRTVLLPQANEKDLRELPQKVLDERHVPQTLRTQLVGLPREHPAPPPPPSLPAAPGP